MEDESNNKSKIDDVRKRLYIKEDTAVTRRRFGVLHKRETVAPTEWAKSTGRPEVARMLEKTPFFKKFFIGSLIFFSLTLVVVLYNFLGGHNQVSTDSIAIEVLGNAYTAGGEELPLQVEIKNQNPVALELADLIIEYPRGGEEGAGQDIARTRASVGTIGANDTKIYDTKLILYGEQGTTKKIQFSLEYRVKGSNAIFTKQKEFVVQINSAPISLTVDAPTETNPNQEVVLKIHASLNATKAVPGMLISMQYPPGFRFKESVPEPVYGNNVWDIGDLGVGSDATITVKGTLLGQDGEDKAFHIYGGVTDGGDKSKVQVVYNSYLHTIAIKKPFFETHIVINDASEEVVAVESGETVRVSIPWANNLDTKILDAQIIASISGNALDKRSIQSSDGYYDSNSGTITWDRNTTPTLASVEPGENGVVAFTFSSGTLLNTLGTFIADPVVTISVDIKGTQRDAGNITQTVKGSDTKSARVITDFSITPLAVYSIGPFTNTGPIPPKAGQTTTYTIIWRVTNTSNRVSGAEVRTTLPSWITWKGQVVPSNANITYISSSREVVWKIGAVAPGAGLDGTSKEAAFQVSFTPSSSQVGSIPQLITESKFSGQDTFTGVQLKAVRNFLSTNMPNDPQYSGGVNGKVTQ